MDMFRHVEQVAFDFSKKYPAKRLYFNQLMTSPILGKEQPVHGQKQTLMGYLLYNTAELTDIIIHRYCGGDASKLYWFYGGSFAWFLQFGQYMHSLEQEAVDSKTYSYTHNLMSGSILPQNLDMWMIAPEPQQRMIWETIKEWAISLESSINALLDQSDAFDWDASTEITSNQLLSPIAEEINPIHERDHDKWRIQNRKFAMRTARRTTHKDSPSILRTKPSDLKVRIEVFDHNPKCTLFNRCKSLLMYLEHKRDPSIQKQLLYIEFPIDISPTTPTTTLLSTMQRLDETFLATYGDPKTNTVRVWVQGKAYEYTSIRTVYPLRRMNTSPVIRKHLPYELSEHMFPALNIFGLSLFKQFIGQQRSDKEYDIDIYRQRLVSYTISGNNTINDKLDEQLQLALLLTYSQTFQSSPHQNVFVLQNYFQKIVQKQTAEFRETLYSTCRGRINELMQEFTPWMNASIPILEERTNHPIRKHTGKARKSKVTRTTRATRAKTHTHKSYSIDTLVFEVGGNVMRRYLEEIQTTNDIDYKIYYEQKYRTLFRDKMLIWSSFVCHALQTTLWQQFFWDAFQPSNVIKTISGSYSYGSIGQYEYVAKLTMFDLTGKNMSFRARYIEKNQDFPIDLFSVDYQTGVNIVITHIAPSGERTVIDTLFIPFLIPILDWSCADKPTRQYRELLETVGSKINPHTLVPNKQWLMDDFHNTYTTPELYRMRIGAGKMEKDMKRIRMLQKAMMHDDYYDESLDGMYSVEQGMLWDQLSMSPYRDLVSPDLQQRLIQSQTVSLHSYNDYQQTMLNCVWSSFHLSELLFVVEQSALPTMKPIQQKIQQLYPIGYSPENILYYLPFTSPILYASLFLMVYRMDKHVGHTGNHKMKFCYERLSYPDIVSQMLTSSKLMSQEDMNQLNRFNRLQKDAYTYIHTHLPEPSIPRKYSFLVHSLPDRKTTDARDYIQIIHDSLQFRMSQLTRFHAEIDELYGYFRHHKMNPSRNSPSSTSRKSRRKRTRKTVKIRKPYTPPSKQRRRITRGTRR